ncbi:hypothetical protein RJ641_003610, partial [Dillenia turbinata]
FSPISLHLQVSSIKKFNGLNFPEWSNKFKSFYKASERSNRLNLMFIRMTVAKNIKSMIPKTDSVKKFMESSVVGTFMGTLTTMKFDSSRTMHEHVTKMINRVAKLEFMGLKVNKNFLVTFMTISLPPQYGPFQINYNTIKDK